MKANIFYSWQSDLPNATNRGFIENALINIVKAIHTDDSINVEPVLDRDTVGVPGSPDIINTIFTKIGQAAVFICDVSIINSQSNTRATPNPNVLIELGYALNALGSERVIMVLNTAYGSPEELPFDLRFRRIITYELTSEQQDKAKERKLLESKLLAALRLIFEHEPLSNKPSITPITPYSLKLQIKEGFVAPHSRRHGINVSQSVDLFQVEVLNVGTATSYISNITFRVLIDGESKSIYVLNHNDPVMTIMNPQSNMAIEPGRSQTFHYPYYVLRDIRTQGKIIEALEVVVRDEIGNDYASIV